MSFLTFHTAMFLSAIDSALMTADVFGVEDGKKSYYSKRYGIESRRVSEKLVDCPFRRKSNFVAFCRVDFSTLALIGQVTLAETPHHHHYGKKFEQFEL